LPVQRVTEAGVSDGEVRVQREGRPVGGFRIGVPVRLAQTLTLADVRGGAVSGPARRTSATSCRRRLLGPGFGLCRRRLLGRGFGLGELPARAVQQRGGGAVGGVHLHDPLQLVDGLMPVPGVQQAQRGLVVSLAPVGGLERVRGSTQRS